MDQIYSEKNRGIPEKNDLEWLYSILLRRMSGVLRCCTDIGIWIEIKTGLYLNWEVLLNCRINYFDNNFSGSAYTVVNLHRKNSLIYATSRPGQAYDFWGDSIRLR
jgi:hypothetical protein